MAWFLDPDCGLVETPSASGWFIAPNGLIYFEIASTGYMPLVGHGGLVGLRRGLAG